VKQFAESCTYADFTTLIASPLHEVRLAALLILCRKFQLARKCPDEQQRCVDLYLQHTARINNWDLVDLSCYVLLGNWLLNRNRALLYDLAAPERSLWENRIAIVTTLQFIRHGESEDTLALATRLLAHPHDLIHKAVGWMLREVGKRCQPLLEAYLKEHLRQMPRTALRYAIEKFPPQLRRQYMH